MTANNIIDLICDIDLNVEGHLDWDYDTGTYYQMFQCSYFDTNCNHEICLHISICDALKWIADKVGDRNVECIGHWHWKTDEGTYTEFEIKKIDIHS